MAETRGLTKFLQDVFDKIENVKSSVESSAPVRAIKLAQDLTNPKVTPQQKAANTLKLVAPVAIKNAPAIAKVVNTVAPKLETKTFDQPNYMTTKGPAGTIITPKIKLKSTEGVNGMAILPPGDAALSVPAAKGTLKNVPVIGEKLQQFAENPYETKNKASWIAVPVRASQEAFDLLVNLGKGLFFGDVKNTRELLDIYNRMSDGLPVTDDEVKRIAKSSNEQMMNLAMAMSSNVESVGGKAKIVPPEKDALKQVAKDIKSNVKNFEQLKLFPEKVQEPAGLLKAPEELKALPGKFVANTKAEAKRLFKFTGQAPELNFVVKGKGEAIPLTSKVEELITTNKKGITIPTEWVDTIKNWTDKGFLGKFRLNRETPRRLASEIMGPEDAAKLNDFLFNRVSENEVSRVKFVNGLRQDLAGELKAAGIKGGSAEDSLIFRYGENRMTLDELKKAAPKNWENIKNLADKFRNYYDDLLDMANAARGKYGYDPIPKRENYFTHIQEIRNIFDELGMILKRPNELPTETAGLTQFFKPGQPFSNFALERKGGQFTESAVASMDAYLDSMTRQIFHTDSVQRARAFEDFIRQRGENLPQFVSWARDYANSLAGKKTDADRVFEDLFGREIYKLSSFISRRFGANAVAGNISSAITNFIPLTQAGAVTDKGKLLTSMAKNMNAPFSALDDLARVGQEESSFLTRRFPVERIDYTKWTQKASDFLSGLFEGIDKYVSKSIVEAKYNEGLAQGLDSSAAIKYADDWAAKIIGDRTIGQTPQFFNSKALAPITQFQLEVNNLWSFLLKDIPKDYAGGNVLKAAYGLTMYSVLAHIYNNVFNSVAGRRPTFDPVQIGLDAMRNDRTGGQKLWAAGGDIINQMPFTSFLTGGRIPYLPTSVLRDVPTMFTSTDPNARTEALTDTTRELFFSLGLPFGGGQLKKSLQGVAIQAQNGVYDNNGNLKFPVGNKLDDVLRSVTFGQYSSPEARVYFDEQLGSLSVQETAVWKRMVESGTDPVVAWAAIYRSKAMKSYINGVKEVIKSGKDIENRQQMLKNHLDIVNQKLDELTGGEDANTGFLGTGANIITPPNIMSGKSTLKVKGGSKAKAGLSTPKLKVASKVSSSRSVPGLPAHLVNLEPPKVEDLLAKADKELQLS